MRRILDFAARELRPGGVLSWTIGFVAVIVFAVDALLNPERMYISLFFMLLGLIFGWRHYVIWKRKRAQNGLILLGTEDPPSEL